MNKEKKSLELEDMVFCMNSDCINYWEDLCMFGKSDYKVPDNIYNSNTESTLLCPQFKEGVNECYEYKEGVED